MIKFTSIISALLLLYSNAIASNTYTTHYSLAKPSDGSTSWGSSIRDDLDLIDTQLYTNSSSITNHISDTVAAHAATAISTTAGASLCTSAITVQAFLDCLDTQFGSIIGGTVVTIAGTQTITGAKTLSAALAGTSATFSGTVTASNITGSNNGDLTLNAFGSTPGANGASISSQLLTLQPADGTYPGGVSTTTQTFAGNKTFSGTIAASNFSGTASGTNTGDITIGTFGSSPTANGLSISSQLLTLQPADGTHSGAITFGTQTIGGAKTFSGAITASNLSGTNTGDQTITLTGDVTGSGTGSFAATIASNAVTNTKAAQMAAHTYKGNNTGSTANAADITTTQLTADLNLFSSSLQGLVPASGGGTTTFLRADGGFATPTAGALSVQSKTGSYTLLTTDNLLNWDTSGGAGTATLPTAVGNTGINYRVNLKTAGNLLTFNTTSSQTIGGYASGVIKMGTKNDSLEIYSDGANWQITGLNISSRVEYHGTASTVSGSEAVIKYSTVETNGDLLSQYSTSTGLFTALYSGVHSVCANANETATYALNSEVAMPIYVNGSKYRNVVTVVGGAEGSAVVGICVPIKLTAGDTVGIYSSNSGTSPAIGNSASQTYMNIARVSN